MRGKVFLALLLFGLGGCSSWLAGLKASMSDGEAPVAEKEKKEESSRKPASIAAEEPKKAVSRRVDPFDQTGDYTEGSLWNGDNQDNFYFSKNVLHKVGDILLVKIEAEVNEALNLKIASYLGRTSVQQVVADEAGKAAGAEAQKKVEAGVGNANVAKAVGAAVQDRTVAAIDEKPRYVDIDEMSVRITEILPRGNYRIEGTKRVFVRSTPYQLRLTGMIRDEDLGPSSVIASGKIIESKMEMLK